ncbi:MAG TPA: hypothetical protein VKZ60_03315 [Chloroflexota bacterium]|jgi:hypothetical protein|nr:hypothetical protein [Chloroflexota bacterium]
MTVQTPTRPIGYAEPTALADELDLDAIDCALDRGDLEAVRRLLGIRRDAWELILARL